MLAEGAELLDRLDGYMMKLTPSQTETVVAGIGRALTGALLPGFLPALATGLIMQAMRNERRAVELLMVRGGPGGDGRELVEKVRRIGKALGESSSVFSEQDALDALFDLEIDAAKYGEDHEDIKRRRAWLAILLLEHGIEG